MKIPPKPKRGKRSPFYWWRRWKSHKYLPVRAGLLARIQNGDFEYPELFEWAEYEMHYMQDELDEFIKNYQGNEDPKTDRLYMDIEKRYRKRYNKLIADAMEVEQRHLTSLVDVLSKEFIITKEEVRTIMESFGDTTESLYLHIANSYDFRKLTKQKTVQLLRAKV
jgi:plasmid maintenance system antidote protein VapI